MSDFAKEINGHVLEFIDSDHIYLVDGVIVPSITQMLKFKFSGKYDGISKATLERAAMRGTDVHTAIEEYCKDGTESDLPEVRNFKFLQKQYDFRVVKNEVPVILFDDGEPIAAGRLDLVLQMPISDLENCKIGGADIKRTSTLDKEYLAYQLNLYRIAYRQCYGIEWEFLRGIHLREDTRKFVTIPINEKKALDLVHDFKEARNE